MLRGNPPWGSFEAFKRAIQVFEEKGLPNVIEPAQLPFARAYSQEVIATLRFLGLLTENNVPTEKLRRFLQNPSRRPEILADALKESYPDVFAPGIPITDEYLQLAFSKYVVSETIRRRMISFFKNAAAYAGVPLSAAKPRYGGGKEKLLRAEVSSQSVARVQRQATQQADLVDVPPVIVDLIKELARIGTNWDSNKKERWFSLLQAAIAYYYPEAKSSDL